MIHRTTSLVKFKKLQHRLGFTKTRDTIGILEAMWLFTQREAPRGDIGKFDNETLAIELEWDGDPEMLVVTLVETRWLDAHPVHRLVVHDWHNHAPRYVHSLVQRYGGFVTGDAHGISADTSINGSGDVSGDVLPDGCFSPPTPPPLYQT